ncbi:DUF3263 domain-containing protein [Klenkia sp. LSe6-5]|uniref:DUF3263 domain-containing protein n=1 Tax=Klenkia sesuvii TaxID=3103137 RepID=A0ABU8DZ17_9ACTN
MLTDWDLSVLDFEEKWWQHAGGKEQAIREKFGASPTRYYQRLNQLIDHPEALAARPMLVRRLLRLRGARLRHRTAR